MGLPDCSIESILSKSAKEISGVGNKDSTIMKTVNLTKTQIKRCHKEMEAEIGKVTKNGKQKQEPDEVNQHNGCGGICDEEKVSDCEYT